MGDEPPPNLEKFAVLQGSNGSKMYLCREFTGQRTIDEPLLLNKKQTEKYPRAASDTPQNLVKLRPRLEGSQHHIYVNL